MTSVTRPSCGAGFAANTALSRAFETRQLAANRAGARMRRESGDLAPQSGADVRGSVVEVAFQQ
jgi:hypothetical protein